MKTGHQGPPCNPAEEKECHALLQRVLGPYLDSTVHIGERTQQVRQFADTSEGRRSRSPVYSEDRRSRSSQRNQRNTSSNDKKVLSDANSNSWFSLRARSPFSMWRSNDGRGAKNDAGAGGGANGGKREGKSKDSNSISGRECKSSLNDGDSAYEGTIIGSGLGERRGSGGSVQAKRTS
jgi:hypothetical protein